jgi:uncharacterized protein (DUF1330 family)
MPAYLLTVASITQRTPQFAEYAQKAAQLSARYGGEYLVRGKATEVLEGTAFESQVAVLTRFPTREQALAFYRSDEYAALKPLRAGTGTYDVGVFDAPG